MAPATAKNTTLPVLHNRTAYDQQAVATLTAMFSPRTSIIPALKPCPFCLSTPEWDGAFHGRAVVYCTDDNCEAQPQITGDTLAAAARSWNRRNHPGCGEGK